MSPRRSPSISPSRPTCRIISGDIAAALAADRLETEFVPLDELTSRLGELSPRRGETIVWALTDGVRFYRGSSVPALARLEGFARFGSPSTAAHLAQDKFASLALASAAGLAVPATRLMEGGSAIAMLGAWPKAGPWFVKPNTLGAKIGIFADSLCESEDEATGRAQRIFERYRDRVLIQPFVEGDDVRVSFMDLGGDFADQLGIERIVKNTASETGGAFLTMKDNETLSGAKDTVGGRGGFGAARTAAFVPHLIDLRAERDAAFASARRPDSRFVGPPRAPREPARLLLDRFPPWRRRPADIFRIRGLSGGDDLRLSELSARARPWPRRGARQRAAGRLCAAGHH